jgi:hypothetical protein
MPQNEVERSALEFRRGASGGSASLAVFGGVVLQGEAKAGQSCAMIVAGIQIQSQAGNQRRQSVIFRNAKRQRKEHSLPPGVAGNRSKFLTKNCLPCLRKGVNRFLLGKNLCNQN